MPVSLRDQPLGATDEAESATGAGSIIALLKRLRTLARVSVGAHANAWDAVAVAANGTSASLDVTNAPFVSAFGNASAATTITLQYSQDGTNWYDGPTVTLGAAGNFRIDATVGATNVRLKSSAAATITATIAGKG